MIEGLGETGEDSFTLTARGGRGLDSEGRGVAENLGQGTHVQGQEAPLWTQEVLTRTWDCGE